MIQNANFTNLVSSSTLESTTTSDDNEEFTIFVNGTILTLAQNSYAPVEALVIQGKIIKFTGNLASAKQVAGANAHVVDLQGKCVLPGFIEPHLHLALTALADHWLLDVSVRTKEEALTKIRDKAEGLPEKTPDGKWWWVAGYGYDPSRVQGNEELYVGDLDKFGCGHPVFILNQSGHVAYVNSRAFELANVTYSSVEHDDNYQKDKNNKKLTGVLFEQAVSTIGALVNKPSDKEMVMFGIETVKKWARSGCTTVFDAGVGSTGVNEIAFLQAVSATKGFPLPLRFYGALSINVATPPLIPIIKQRPIEVGNAKLTAIKFWADGSTQGFTAALNKPYHTKPPDDGPERGTLNYKTNELLQAVMEPWLKAGWQLLVHANGDRAIDQALDVYETIFKNNPTRDESIMHRIEHFTVVTDREGQIGRAKKLGLGISHTIGHVRYWGPTFRHYVLGKERADGIDPVKSDDAMGIVYSFHSDSPLTQVCPLEYVYTAVTRQMCPDEKGVLNKDECVDLLAALRGVTINPAIQIGTADKVGTLEKNKEADLVVLDKDPRSVESKLLPSLNVEQTWVAGKKMFDASD
jgi:predicted amidohydrolase YtcJ